MKIKLKDDCDKSLVLAFIQQISAEQADDILLEEVVYGMRKRLKEKRELGVSGWNTSIVDSLTLKRKLLKNIKDEDWVDVINLAAMLMLRANLFEEVES